MVVLQKDAATFIIPSFENEADLSWFKTDANKVTQLSESLMGFLGKERHGISHNGTAHFEKCKQLWVGVIDIQIKVDCSTFVMCLLAVHAIYQLDVY